MQSDRILVVDDEDAIREIVVSMLASAHYECRQAGSGLEALALLNSGEEFELMLSDLMMADLDGIGLLERTKEKYPDMPVVMVTAVHDISVALAAIRDHIIRKPGKLDPDEVAIMREHCYHGYQMLRKIPFLQDACDIVYSHQEKYDGTGYPRGLKADETPLGARIFSIADTLDAITSNRPYRAAQSLTAAREEIERWSGRQFDPEVVKVFLRMPDNIWEDLRREIDSQVYRFSYSAVAKG